MSNIHTPERLEGESFKDYKARRKLSHQVVKLNKKGKVFWNVIDQGTYVNKEKTNGKR